MLSEIDKKQVTQIGFVYETEKRGLKITSMRSRLPNGSMI